MKKYIIIVFAVLISIIAHAQTKKEVQYTLDTLIKSNKNLHEDYNQLKKEWNIYNQFFMHVKDKFFPPEEINLSVNEAISRFDQLYSNIENQLIKNSDINLELRDSIATLSKISTELEKNNDIYRKLILSSLSESFYPKSEKELVGQWNLFLNPLSIKGDPFESGIVGINVLDIADSISCYNIFKIEIQQDDLATLFFSDGKEQKCFYSISEFSHNMPYSVYFSKQEEFKLVLRVSPMHNGLMVSYEIPVKTDKVLYYYGLMKRK